MFTCILTVIKVFFKISAHQEGKIALVRIAGQFTLYATSYLFTKQKMKEFLSFLSPYYL